MLPYCPFRNPIDLGMGARAYTNRDHVIEVDGEYLHEVRVKQALLRKDHEFYYKVLPEARDAQWEVVRLLLGDMAAGHPEHFTLDVDGDDWTFHNELLGETTHFRWGDATTLPYEPLDWVGRQVQEDLVLLSPDGDARLVGGQLCFPNGWSLAQKWNQPFLTIHKPAPKVVGPTMQTSHKLINRMKLDRPVWRASWNFRLANDLDMSNRETERLNAEYEAGYATLTVDDVGERMWVRIERQTLLKLPQTGFVLFAIHTYQGKLADEVVSPDRAGRMLGTIQTAPRELLDYKMVTPIEDVLVQYLSRFVGDPNDVTTADATA